MRIHTACLGMMSWFSNIQRLDPTFEPYGSPFAEFKSSWEDKAFSLLFTNFGRLAMPTFASGLRTGGPTLNDYLEARSCRRNYQGRLLTLETVIQEATAKHGRDAISNLAPLEVRVYGAELVTGMAAAGLTFANQSALAEACQHAKDFHEQVKAAPALKSSPPRLA